LFKTVTDEKAMKKKFTVDISKLCVSMRTFAGQNSSKKDRSIIFYGNKKMFSGDSCTTEFKKRI
jgi:hypothetical protein